MQKKTNVTVSIATIPSRINYINRTIDSLIYGSLPPDRIIISFPRYCELMKSGYIIPDFLKDGTYDHNRIFMNEIEKDWGPGTKYIGPLPLLNEDELIIIADDDVVYHRDFVKGLYDRQIKEKDYCFSYYTYREGGITIGQGCDGISLWSRFLQRSEEFAYRYVDGTNLIYHDDLWIAFFLASKGIYFKKADLPKDVEIIYKQILPNDVLSSMEGNRKRQNIVGDNFSRLMGSDLIRFPMKIKFSIINFFDFFREKFFWALKRFKVGFCKDFNFPN